MERRIDSSKRLLVCLSALVMMGQVPQQDFHQQINEEVCVRYEACFPDRQGCTEAFPDYGASSECTYDAVAAEACLTDWGAWTCNDFFQGDVPPRCEDVYTCDYCVMGDGLSEGVGNISFALTGDPSTLCNAYDSNVSREATLLGNPDWGTVPGSGDYAECHAVSSQTMDLSQADLDAIQDFFPCGEGINGRTVCANLNATLVPGLYVVVINVLEGDVPLQDAERFYQYGFPFDVDRDQSNNYQPGAPFTGDFFANTQLWIELRGVPGGLWSVAVTDATNNNFQALDSAARITATGNIVFLLVPRAEFNGNELEFRVTMHVHLGDFGETNPTSADTEPPIDQALRAVADGGTSPNLDGGVPDGGVDPNLDGGVDPNEEDDGGCGCRVSSRSIESNATLALLLVGVACTRRWRRRRR